MIEKIKQITILGSGIMGHGIAQISATAGYTVILRDIEQSFLDSAMGKIKWSLGKMVEKNKISAEQADKILERITPMVDLKEAVSDSDMIIEAVPEDLNLKKKVYSEVDKHADSRTIYASNTSTLPITEISALTNRPEKFVGIHFFNPPQLMQLVEVIPGRDTTKDITQLAIDFVTSVGKQPILCSKDVAGFIVNRVFIPMVHEAAYCRERENVTLTQIDSAVKYNLAFPMGIFELADFTGLDVIHKATVEMHARDSKVINPHPIIKQLFEEKKLGKKTNQGFYKYGEGQYERINLSQEQADSYDPIRLLAVAANNAAWLLSNNVCSKTDLDKALKLGMGLKINLFELVERNGIKKIVHELNSMSERYGSFYNPDEYLLDLASKA